MNGFAAEHPVPVTVMILADAMKKQRALHANDTTLQECGGGMKNLAVTEEEGQLGGTELAPMSTSTSMVKIAEYCKSEHPLILRVVSNSF